MQLKTISTIALSNRDFLMCSFWPGGSQLNYWALHYSTPIALAYPAWSRIIDGHLRKLCRSGC